ncbi:FAD binding domain-containing protein [Hirsutella rhossiliensis]|uniref:FAD binding domain-containing protein n=1 Tax=Hirsutella rhossiliensis TaxID=111463 RepID=A0A9P8SIQ7_9HYPO|nr:FAD binding domain-containing protein [Hirsutella rhossiliensis]KAH0963439.1 FAD binding domain-containing protein [Hirsutella rhossiliensis]
MAPGILDGSSALDTPLVDVEHQLAPVDEDQEMDAVADLTMLRSFPEPPAECQVCIVGAGPAGLMLAATLTRCGIHVEVIDDRADHTPVGRADGLQPKTIETFRQLRLADTLLQRGVCVFDISFWRSTAEEPLHRLGREVHYPPIIDVLDPYILLVHQGIVESLFIDDMKKRGKDVRRNTAFDSYDHVAGKSGQLQVNCRINVTHDKRTILTRYLVGCDGAHSKVRKSIPDVEAVGMSQAAIWGVLDGELITNFPDIWSKTLVYSEEHGSILIIPRERNMTRFYIELKACASTDRRQLGQNFVMQQARKIMAPFSVDWRYIEWFGRYQVGQRVASRFADAKTRVFLSGDASHTHSPKAAQGMNTSMHDSWNLSWKLNLAVRGLAKPELLESYEKERRKIALDLVNFDYEHANQIAGGDAVALAKNFKANVRFISGIGAEYGNSSINRAGSSDGPPLVGDARPGCLLPPAKVTRYIDSNPVDVQLDIPMLGQFRIFLLMWDVQQAAPFLTTFCRAIADTSSFVSQISAAASASYATQPRLGSPEDVYIRPERYTAVSHLFTFALITTMAKAEIEISDLPAMLQDSRWTLYLDDIPEKDTRGQLCTDKWLGSLEPGEVAIVNVRPDGYVGSVDRWDSSVDDAGVEAARWVDDYYGGFMQIPKPTT